MQLRLNQLLAALLITATAALQPKGMWGTAQWAWGSAVGGAHDAAAELRSALSTEDARRDYLIALRQGRVSDASAKMAFALTCQRTAISALPAPFHDAYSALVQGAYERDAGLADLAACAAAGVERYNLNVQLSVKPERVAEFLQVIEANTVGTLREPRNLRYAWGDSATAPGVYHFQESFVGKQGFDEHCATPTFTAWEAFAGGTDPFTAEPSVQFYVPTTSLADDHAPTVCMAAFLATLDFVPHWC